MLVTAASRPLPDVVRVPRAARPWALTALVLLAAPCHASGIDSGNNGNCVSEEPFEYRLSDFRAPTPCTLEGATVLSTAGVAELAQEGEPVLIDVFPAPRRPANLAPGSLWLPTARDSLPGGVWLPNTGFGVLPVEEERYLRDNLRRLTAGSKTRALVFYCERDCWMSWNAARRAVAWDYGAVYWYPGGTDDWKEAGRALASVLPVAREAGQ